MRFMLTLSLILVCATASAGEVYRWRDKDGRLHYGDKPKDVQAESVMVSPNGGSGEPSAGAVAEKDRAGECARRKEQLAAWRSAPTMSEVDNLGKTREYTPAEREQFLALTQQKVDSVCTPPPTQAQSQDFPPPPPPEEPVQPPPEEPAQ